MFHATQAISNRDKAFAIYQNRIGPKTPKHPGARAFNMLVYSRALGSWPQLQSNMLALPITVLFAIALSHATATGCARGSFSAGGVCKPCPPGTMQNERNKTSCTPCAPGTFRPFPGAFYFTQCLKCRAGFTSSAGSAVCRRCPPGTFSRPGWSRCVPRCKPGYGFSRYSEACERCERSTFNDGTTFECRRCPSGTAAAQSGAAECTACTPGTFRDMRFVSRIDIARCFKCPINTFSASSGARQCSLCPSGTVATPGAKSCSSCPPGTFRFGLRYLKCMPCPKGTSSVGRRPARCRHPKLGCPFGTFLADGECRACRPGERLHIAKRICVPCPRGWVSRGGSTARCEVCPTDEEPEDDVSIFEGAQCRCKTGWQRDTSGRCRRCASDEVSNHRPPGAIWDSNWRVFNNPRPFCSRCSTGEIPTDGSSRCSFCPIGSVPTPERDGSCTSCPKGTRPDPGELIGQEPEDLMENPHRNGCLRLEDNCPVGTRLARTGSQQGNCVRFACPANTLFNPLSGGFCLRCGPFERLIPGEKRCTSCPDGSANPSQHIRPTCKPCGPNGHGSFDGGCGCKVGFVRKNERCVACSAGTVATKAGCLRCASGVWTPRLDGFGECRKCPGALVLRTIGVTRCLRCKPRFTRAYDVLGEATEKCKPIGGYFPTGFTGDRLG